MSLRQIDSLEDLYREKKALELRTKISRQEFSNSVGDVRKKLGNFLLFKIAIPAGVVSLASMGIKKMTESKTQVEPQSIGSAEETDQGIQWSKLFARYLPQLLNLVQTYVLIKEQQDENQAPASKN